MDSTGQSPDPTRWLVWAPPQPSSLTMPALFQAGATFPPATIPGPPPSPLLLGTASPLPV